MYSTFFILNIGNENLRLHGALQGNHNVHTGFVTIGDVVNKFKFYRQTDIHTNTMVMLKVCSLECFAFQKAKQYTTYMTVVFICLFCVHLLHLLKHRMECHDVWRHKFEDHQTTVGFSSLPLVTMTWRTREFVEQQQHKPHLK